MKTAYKYIFALILSLSVLACTKTIEQDQIYLSHSSFTFKAIGESLEIGVDANVEWDIVNDLDWITVGEKTDTSIVITAAANEVDQSRDGVIKFVAGNAQKLLSVSQLNKSFSGKFEDISTLAKVNFSKNGRFYGGFRIEYLSDGNTSVYYPTIVDCYTGEVKEYESGQGYSELRALSDDGNVFVITLDSGETLVYNNGVKSKLEMSGYMWIMVEAMSSDGSVMVGYAQDKETHGFVPVKWTNLQPEILEVPEENSRGEQLWNGAMARGCSEDGSVIYGSEWDAKGLIYWRDGKMYYPGKDYAEKKTVILESWWGIEETEVYCIITKTAEPYSMSPNGKYIAATYNDYLPNGDEPATALNYAVVVDTETNEVHFIKSDDIQQLTGMSVDNDGICYGGSPAEGVSDGYVMDYKTSSVTPINDWMLSKYGVVVDIDRIVLGVSSDGNVLYGWKPTLTLLGVQYNSWYYIVDPEKK